MIVAIFDQITRMITDAAKAGTRASDARPASGGLAGAAGSGARLDGVDVEAILAAKEASKGGKYNWRTSIADLMRLLDLDPSLDNRKELASELGYTGALDGSAEMNIWLHRQVMAKLGEHGGLVPAELKD
jgi:hypothetical protein